MKVGTFPFFALFGLLAVVHSAPSDLSAQEEVYREAVTDGYVIDNFYFNWFTTESSKTRGAAQTSQQLSAEEGGISEASGDTSDEAETSVVLQYGGKATTATPRAWSTEQPSLESKERDLLEGSGDTAGISVFPQHHVSTTTSVSPDWSTQQSTGSGLLEGSRDTTDVSIFLQNGSKHAVSTTASVSPGWSTDQPSWHSEESVSLTGSGDTTDLPIFSQRGPKLDVSTTASVPHARSPSTAVLPGDAEGSGSGDVRLSDGEIIHSTTRSGVSVSYTDTSPTSSISTRVLKRKFPPLQSNTDRNVGATIVQSESQKEEPTLLPSVGQRTPGWIIILAFIVGVAALIMVCIAIATRDKWNAPNKALSPDSESKMKSINQQRAVEMETFLQKDQPRENGRVMEYTVIPLDELPEKYSSV